jgi:hypothetical protein
MSRFRRATPATHRGGCIISDGEGDATRVHWNGFAIRVINGNGNVSIDPSIGAQHLRNSCADGLDVIVFSFNSTQQSMGLEP